MDATGVTCNVGETGITKIQLVCVSCVLDNWQVIFNVSEEYQAPPSWSEQSRS